MRGFGRRFRAVFAQHVTAPPNGFDIIIAAGRRAQFLAQLTHEHVDNLQFRFVDAAVEMVQEHFLGQRRALAQRQEFQNAIFLTGQMQRLIVHIGGLGVEINGQAAGTDDRVRMALGAADNGLNTGHQLALIEGFRQVIIGAEAQALNLVIKFRQAGQDQDRCAHPRLTEAAQHLVPVDIRQDQVEQDNVVIIEFADLNAVFAKVGGIDNIAGRRQHQRDAFRGCGIILH